MKYYSNIFIFCGYLSVSVLSLISAIKFYKKKLYIQMTSFTSLSIAALLLGLSYGKQLLNNLNDTQDSVNHYLKIIGHIFFILYVLILFIPYIFFSKLGVKFDYPDYLGFVAHAFLLYVVYFKLSHYYHLTGIILLTMFFILKEYFFYGRSIYKAIAFFILIIGFVLYIYIDDKEYKKENETETFTYETIKKEINKEL